MDTLLRYEKLLNHLHATNNRKHLRVQLGHMVNHVDIKRLDNDNAYKKLYNRIRLKYANMNTRFNTLTRIEKLINNGKSENAYRKLLTHTNWNLARNNPNYGALYNRVANKLVAKGYTSVHRVHAPRPINIKSRQQQGGTCWFHGIINGLLMSPQPRQVLRTMVAQMNLGPDDVNTMACPARTASATWFWKYIRHRLSSGGVVSPVFKNKNVIRSVGLRQKTVRPGGLVPRFSNTVSTWRGRIMASRSGVTGGTQEDFVHMYQKLFPGNFTTNSGTSTPLFVLRQFGSLASKVNPYVPHTMDRNGVRYDLSHAWIMFNVRPFLGHVVTGYKTKYGTFRTYDSGTHTVYPNYDWTVRQRVSALLTMYENYLPFPLRPGGIKIWAVYMRPS
jgi:hypothetical protein